LVASIVLQVFYPPGRTVPFQRVGNKHQSFKTAKALKAELQTRQQTLQLNLDFNDKQQTIFWKDTGITIDADKVASQATRYRWWQRLIPMSGVIKSLHNTDLSTHVDQAKLNAYSEKLANDNFLKPANASLSVNGTTVVRNNEKPGHKYDTAEIANKLQLSKYKDHTVITFQPTEIKPAYGVSQIEATAKKAEAIIASPLQVQTDVSTKTVSPNIVASWLKFNETPADHQLVIEVDKQKVKDYLNSISKEVYKAPGTTTVTLRDGQEVQRTADASGQTLDQESGATTISSNIVEAKPSTVKVPVTKIPPKLVYQKSYTKSQAGMNALVNDLAADEPDMAIAVGGLDGSGISASAKGSKTYMPASTYKLSVAYEAIKRIEAGSLNWSDNVNGRNVDQCITDMIVVSDNACGSALGDKLGWQSVTNSARGIGMVNTNLAKGFVSTVNDQATFLTKLEQGQLVNSSNRDKLLGLMKRQKYRSGIPAGVNGATVADKVGFIDGLYHDSAIVYGPKGTYVLSIYSNKGSWARMAKVTSRIHELMSQ